MQTVFKIFQDLKNNSSNNGESYVIASLPSIKNHKIGISHSLQPMFFINCDNSKNTKLLDTNLEFITVQFNRQCQLINKNKKVIEGDYTIISLKTESDYLQEYFLKIVYVLIKDISEKPLLKDLKIEIEKLLNLFTKFSKPPLKTIQGLWAELLLIEQSKNPDYLIQSWHNSTFDKYDFNDGIDKIEVKSTTKSRRLHNFSLEQLTPNLNSNLIITSIFTIETGTGKNVFDLIERIENKIKDKILCFKVFEMVALTLGKDFEKSFEIFFDYQFAVDSIKYYNNFDIPTISNYLIPSNIINVRFDCDLTDLKTVTKMNTKSKLHNSLY
ncbi:MAG: PD-(D/E)XK motif protein [Flavobacteriaceae bacterium]|nr:PD-(D/E)XK motif protein [Flavobacteriaceae bacterium]